MRMGARLLRGLDVELGRLDHRIFPRARRLIETEGERYFREAVDDIEVALELLYGRREVPLQHLSATFRRGDLISILNQTDMEAGKTGGVS
jgi:hypothetical protein